MLNLANRLFGTDFSNKVSYLFSIIIPIFITQITIVGMNFFDASMSGHASATDLAGAAIAGNLWMPIFTGINGILIATIPLVAHLIGGNEKHRIGELVQHGFVLAVGIAVAVIIFGFVSIEYVLEELKLEQQVAYVARYYLLAIAFGVVPFFLTTVMRSILDVFGDTKVTMKIFLCALPINAVLNYIFIFGKLGVPAFGGIGAGIATSITYWILFFMFTRVCLQVPQYKELNIFVSKLEIKGKLIKEYLRVGIPLGAAIFMETSIFCVIAFFIAKFGTEIIAANQAALNVSTLFYMIPLSISMGLTIVVGVEAGAKRWTTAKEYGNLGLTFNLTCAAMLPFIVYFSRNIIAGFYSTDPAVTSKIVELLFYAIFFQMADAIAVPIQGILRGYKDVKPAFYASMVAYWIIALPLGAFLDYYLQQGAISYWIGLDAGVFVSALVLAVRLRWTRKQFI